MVHVSAHQGTDAGRVNVGNLGEVEDEGGRSAAPHHGLKRKEIGDEDGTVQAQNALAPLAPR